ncbi:venom serine protease-like [Teleopsis dalmanni]|uniref:venom serine protease-like n=1 Tax=Teleopsis dalmanni TaxID=139649 RepID=UPI0018CF1B6A|nr:venom serine protease-like [Teleopsis dalmanni]
MKSETRTIISAIYLWLLFFTTSTAQECRPQQYQMYSTQQVLNITSPNYPNAYMPGSSCRYKILAPLDHVVILNCVFEVYPNSCGSENFYVSRDGDFQYRDAEIFCSSGSIRRTSLFRSITFAYSSIATTTNLRGRFFCQAITRPQPCDCGWSFTPRITNGQEANKHEYPSMVALRDITSPQLIFCGGNIISHRHILTAAHCTSTHRDPSRIMAYAGDHDLSSTTESAFAAQYNIQQIIQHPGYISNSAAVANDIALLVTSRIIEWSRGVGPVCLPYRQSAESFTYLYVNVAGWGTLTFAGSKSNTLQKAELLTMDNRACQIQYNSTILPSQICTYDYSGTGRDSCQYDSGGPVIQKQTRMYLIGIISFGRTCGTRYAVGVNTRITAFLNWIWSYVGGNNICVI